MQPYNWDQFTKRIYIDAAPGLVYSAWASQAGLEKWFLRKALFTTAGKRIREKEEVVEAGDSYEWFWFGYPDSISESKSILEANGDDYLQFSFSGNCVVSVHLKKEKEGTLCVLVQSMITADEKDRPSFYIECGNGWVFYMANLKSVLEGGIDLRNKDESLLQVINA